MRWRMTNSSTLAHWRCVDCELVNYDQALGAMMTELMLSKHRALVSAFEHGTKATFSASTTESSDPYFRSSLNYLLSTISSTVEPFTNGTRTIDFNRFSPLTCGLVYQAAVITTNMLSMEFDTKGALARLKMLRMFLRIAAKRWQSCGKLIRT